MAKQASYNFNKKRPPVSPQTKNGGIVNAQHAHPSMDTAKYLLTPDTDFARPYLAVAGTRSAFIWPVGTEAFDIEDSATLGRHRYLGGGDLDVNVTHRRETTITMTGTFPGWTSVENMVALRQVFAQNTPEKGKILHLPGIMPHLQYVACERLVHSHAKDERSQDIDYTLVMVVIGTGPKAPKVALSQTSASKGRGLHSFKVTAKINTLRKIAKHFYGTEDRWTVLYSISQNAHFFDKAGIASHEVPNHRINPGIVIYYS